MAILASDPGNPLAKWMLATIEIEAGKPRLAAQYAMSASSNISGLGIPDLLRITWALIVSGQGERASQLLLAIDPEDPANKPGLWGAARQLGLLELHTPALRLLDAIIDPRMRNVSVTTLRGHLLSVLGRREDAADSFEESIHTAPASPLAHLMLSRLNLPTGRAQRVNRLRRMLRNPPGDLDHFAMLQYALFNELDALDDTRQAWSALMAGADARNRLLPYDADQETRLFDQMIEAITADFLSTGTVPLRPSQRAATPIFIVGMPRTGTTMLERILGNHPDVQSCGELTAFVQQHQWVADRVWAGMFDERAAIEQPHIDAALLGERYLNATAWRTRGKHFFSDKTPGNFMAVALILKAIPHARIIHLHRNPVDTCFSNLKVLFAPDVYPYSSSLSGLASHYRNYARLMRHWNEIFPDKILNLAYEDLVSDSEHHAERILAYCGLNPCDNITDLTTNRNSVSTESRSQVREAIHHRNIGGWLRYAQFLAPLERLLAGVAG